MDSWPCRRSKLITYFARSYTGNVSITATEFDNTLCSRRLPTRGGLCLPHQICGFFRFTRSKSVVDIPIALHPVPAKSLLAFVFRMPNMATAGLGTLLRRWIFIQHSMIASIDRYLRTTGNKGNLCVLG